MKLKEIRPVLAGEVILYEETGDEKMYRNIFIGDCREIPEEIQERDVVVIGASSKGEMMEIELKKEQPKGGENRCRGYRLTK